jgi:hypothetical protein
MKTELSPISRRVLKAARRVLRDKKSIVMSKGKLFDYQFRSIVDQNLGCEMPTSLLCEELDFLVTHDYLDKIVRDDAYGIGTVHYLGDGE